jgi:hypothetical protein
MPALPGAVVDEPPPFDTAVDEPDEEVDTGDELPPATICANMEQEPNGEVDEAQELPLEQWMCGYFGELGDNDLFAFDIEEASWLRVWVRAQELGSLANPRAFLYDEDREFDASFEDSFLSADIDRTFKLDEGRELFLGILEQEVGSVQFGEEYEWRLRVSVVKAPVTWTSEEVEENDSRAEANPVVDGDRVFGRIEHGLRYDWFELEVTEDREDVSIETDSWSHGSPLNPEIMVEGPDGTEIGSAFTHDSASNFDAKVAFTATEPGTYKIRVGSCCAGDGARPGGLPNWYVLDVSSVPVVVETEDTGDGR